MDLSRLAFPLLRHLDPETAHGLTIWGLARGFGPAQQAADDPVLRCRLWGYDFPNPVGIAAGFDKNGEAFDPLLRAGFGFTEVGTVTPRPQAGNPRPRLFRLVEDKALINRMGFNNEGLDKVANRLSNRHGGIVGANIGRNKDSTDADRDYAAAAGRLAPLIEYLVINVSSPNTPGLRALQDRKALESLIRRVRAAMRDSVVKPPALLVKIAPDLTPEDEADIAALAEETNLQGLIISNTTVERPASLTSPHKDEAGGLERHAAVRDVDRAGRPAVQADRRAGPPGRRWRDRQRPRRVRQDPRRGVAGAALLRARPERAGVAAANQARAGLADTRRRLPDGRRGDRRRPRLKDPVLSCGDGTRNVTQIQQGRSVTYGRVN